MQVDPMDDDVGIMEARAQRRPGRDPRDLVAGERIEHQQRGWKIGLCQNRVGDADTRERMKHVGAELNAVADGAERRRAFEHAHRAPVPRQRKRRGEAAKPAANNEGLVFQGRLAFMTRAASADRYRLWCGWRDSSPRGVSRKGF